MTHATRNIPRGSLFAILWAGVSVLSSATALERVGRYSTLSMVPSAEQRDLLGRPVTTPIPASAGSVGAAVEVVLQGSGYRLSPPPSADPARAQLLTLPLPAAHRELGHLNVRHALQMLAGPAFELVEDPVHRLISFERCAAAVQPRVTATAAPR